MESTKPDNNILQQLTDDLGGSSPPPGLPQCGECRRRRGGHAPRPGRYRGHGPDDPAARQGGSREQERGPSTRTATTTEGAQYCTAALAGNAHTEAGAGDETAGVPGWATGAGFPAHSQNPRARGRRKQAATGQTGNEASGRGHQSRPQWPRGRACGSAYEVGHCGLRTGQLWNCGIYGGRKQPHTWQIENWKQNKKQQRWRADGVKYALRGGHEIGKGRRARGPEPNCRYIGGAPRGPAPPPAVGPHSGAVPRAPN
ncbi:hypothetical protein F5X68DRAFT_217908 [Plectosphaerella plurivora]|uniref:Uncharacterized protein n=1 Tax=Plectosphaerella plurivora TaxID=936078 RepID=A0A9P8V117_9PEZI|nr:hypothetical protein F5X68DRAFT_217908 [Plectosphaerella plurivora]